MSHGGGDPVKVIAFEPSSTLKDVERVTDEIETRIREKIPDMKKIFIESDSDGDLRGVVRAEVAEAARQAAVASRGGRD